jgi:hypothetical protein
MQKRVVDIIREVATEVKAEMLETIQANVLTARNAYFTSISKPTLTESPVRDIPFMYGHPSEIITRLQQMSSHPTAKYEKFPAIILFTDLPEEKGKSGLYASKVNLHMVIASVTSAEFTSDQRLVQSFEPCLSPLYDSLMGELAAHKDIVEDDAANIVHTEWKRFFWGKTGLYSNTGNVFQDFIDAIEITNIQLTIRKTNNQ